MLRRIKNFIHCLEAIAANWYYGFPGRKMKVIGVTGTDGKTTTVNLIHHILTIAGYKTAILSTLSSVHTTTPNSWRLLKFLSQSLKNGCTHAVIEVSSHAVDQNRVWGVDFAVGVLTNIADNEHLDYHGTFANYRKTKIKWLVGCQSVVVNADDESIREVRELEENKGKKIWTYGIKNRAEVKPDSISYTTKLLGEFNTYNILAAASAAKALGLDNNTIAQGIKTFESPAGRLEIITRKPYTVIVDFAHTPQAFARVLPVAKSLKATTKNSLIHVFGATGNRDRGKRPVMAKIAARYDDYIFLTHEDTYSEDPKSILTQIETGLKNYKYANYLVEYDRREAIRKALSVAKRGDVVILTGVGHQKSMNVGGKEVPWSEQKIVREILDLK